MPLPLQVAGGVGVAVWRGRSFSLSALYYVGVNGETESLGAGAPCGRAGYITSARRGLNEYLQLQPHFL